LERLRERVEDRLDEDGMVGITVREVLDWIDEERARANPYANARVIDEKPIKMEDLPR
jgi:hypothetical protein